MSYEGRLCGRVGRGITFHIAPGNVPINFAYSLVAGLLAGNVCVIKASSKDFVQIRLICNVIKEALVEVDVLAPYVHIVIYDRALQQATEYFSSICNVRIIWGGDRAIAAVREAAMQPRAFDIPFADRYSLAVFDAKAILELQDDSYRMAVLVQDFYNDTYLYDQNACTSPQLICWLGSETDIEAAQQLFWQNVYDNIKDRYHLAAVTAVDKLMAISRTAIAIKGAQVKRHIDNRIVCVHIPKLCRSLRKLRAPGGFFLEYHVKGLADLGMVLQEVVDESWQTMSCYGLEVRDLRLMLQESGLHGIDRITAVGHTADFALVWDGNDLIDMLSRVVTW